MEFKYIALAAIIAAALLVCGCAGAVAVVIPALNNELPASHVTATIDPAAASDPIVGTWKMVNPVIKEGDKTVDQTDARWYFGADGSYKQCPLLIDIFKTTGTWTRVGEDRYEVVCGKDSRLEYYKLVDGQLCLEGDQRYLLSRTG
jgi:hypothetical protein